MVSAGVAALLRKKMNGYTVIAKNLSLLGVSSDTTTINAQELGDCIQMMGSVTEATLSGFTLAPDTTGTGGGWAVGLQGASNVTVTNNRLLEGSIELSNAHSNYIADNDFEGDAAYLHMSDVQGNRIEGNNPAFVMLFRGHNNVISNNVMGREPDTSSCNCIRVVDSSNNSYISNTLRNCRVHILVSYSNDSVFANNRILGKWQSYDHMSAGGIIMHHARNNQVLNNEMLEVADGGARRDP